MRALPMLIGLLAFGVACNRSAPTQPSLTACLVYDDSHNLVLEDRSGIRDSVEVPARVFMASSIEPGPGQSALVASHQRHGDRTYRDTIDVVDLTSGAVLDRWVGGEAVYSEGAKYVAYVDESTFEVWVSPWPRVGPPRSCGHSVRRERPWSLYRTVVRCGDDMFCFVQRDGRTLVACVPSVTEAPHVRNIGTIGNWIPVAWRRATRSVLLVHDSGRLGEIQLDGSDGVRILADNTVVPSTAIYVESADALLWGTRGFMELPMRVWLSLTGDFAPIMYRAPFVGDGFVKSGSCPGGA